MGWTRLGSGSFNTAYKSEDGKSVLKIRIKKKEAYSLGTVTDAPTRSVQIWNKINNDLQPPAYEHEDSELGAGWISPFVEGHEASDQEISDALIDIFNRTGRIVIDATAKNNFIKTPDGRVVCVDIGMALQVEKNEDEHFLKKHKRSNSLPSLLAWKVLQHSYDERFVKDSRIYPVTTNTIKSLLFIKINRPDITNASFMKNNTKCLEKLSTAYDNKNQEQDALQYLNERSHLTFDSTKKSCINELINYIDSRGAINNKEFIPSLVTKLFRDNILTNNKVSAVMKRIDEIQNARSISEIQTIIHEMRNDRELTKAGSFFTSYLSTKLGRCEIILDTARYYGLEHDNAQRVSPDEKQP